jgi:hypothetical protein
MSAPVTTVDQASLTRQQRAVLPLSTDVAQAIAEQHGVCVRPLAMRRIDITTGRIAIVPVPCGSTREDQCQPCSDTRRDGCGWPNAAKAGTWKPNPPSSGQSPTKNNKS